MAARDHDQDVTRCPRCETEILVRFHGPDEPGKTALSRATRDGGAFVFVCLTCGDREAMRDDEGWPQVPPTEWPVSIDELLREDRLRYEFARSAAFQMLRIDELKGGES
jgi:hypothetical protein